MLDTARHALALALVALAPPAFLAWLAVHPLVSVWRRLGAGRCYALLAVYYVSASGFIFSARDALLARRFEFSPSLALLGLALLALATLLRIAVHRQLTWPIMFGRPEIDPRAGDRLLDEGIYARLRHPRYVEAFLGIAGLSLVANYQATWLVTALYLPAIALVIALEERELRHRFGGRWLAYARRVPRLVPRTAWRAS